MNSVWLFLPQIHEKEHNQFQVQWEWGELMVVGEEGNLSETVLVYKFLHTIEQKNLHVNRWYMVP